MFGILFTIMRSLSEKWSISSLTPTYAYKATFLFLKSEYGQKIFSFVF